jgi:imidazoleglycerol-phosphate dehydratase
MIPKETMITRTTRETTISLDLRRGTDPSEIATGIGFFDHMLELFAFHGHLVLKISAQGDLTTDFHHTVEDTGILLGEAIQKLVAEQGFIQRFGWAYIPLNESLGRVVVDLCGRPHLEFSATFPTPYAGEFPLELVEEFFRSLAMNARATIHADLIRCRNSHHGAEVLFKALGVALRQALTPSARLESTKGALG